MLLFGERQLIIDHFAAQTQAERAEEEECPDGLFEPLCVTARKATSEFDAT
jgi:hypothetical protein